MGQRTAGDKMFEAYLSERGLAVPEHEPDLGIGVRPEYVVEHDAESCLVEVKEFARESNPIQGSGSFTQQQTLKPIRGQIHEAARKLRRGRDLGFPLVVVLTDPNRALMGLLGPTEVIAAMHGDLMIRVARSGPPEAATMTTGRNGELRNDHPYISAVTVIHESLIASHFAHTFLTHARGAIPLPRSLFAGHDDRVFEYSEEAERYVPIE